MTPNHALQRTGAAVTPAASCLRLSPTTQRSRQPRPSLSLGSLGDFAHLLRLMSASEDIPSLMPPAKLNGLKTSSSESIASPTVWHSVASHPSVARRFQSQPGVSRQRVRRHSCSAFIVGRPRPHAPRAAAPCVSTARRFWAFLHRVRSTESQLSRHSRSGIHRESGRYSQNSFRVSLLNPTSPNHALQRTAPRVTARAFCERRVIYIWASAVRSTVGHAPRHAPPSLSLGSLGVAARSEKQNSDTP